MKKSVIFLLCLFLLDIRAYCATGAIDSTYTYDYSRPPEFQPSINSQFTALSSGVNDIFANPAGLTRVQTFEVALSASDFVKNPIKSDENTVYVEDVGMQGLDLAPNSKAFLRMTDDRSVITAEPRPLNINEDYSKGGGINYFGMTYRISDWLAVAISRRRPTSMNFNYKMLAPFMMDVLASGKNSSFEVGSPGDFILIRPDGTAEVYSGGIPVATSEIFLWEGFLEQGTSEVNWLSGTFDNSIVNQNSVVISAAAKTGAFSWGLNIIPMTVDMELNNEVFVMSDSSNVDLRFSEPDFDYSSIDGAMYWVTTEAGIESGYRSITIETLAGQQLGAAKVAGKYSGSMTRMDFGMQWDLTDFMTVGGVYENFNGAVLDLKGVNVIQYVEHRLDTTSHFPTQEGSYTWNPFLPTATHEVETERVIRNTLTMQPIELPRKLKFGVALRKPFTLAMDWEQWQNEYKFTSDPGHPETAHYITIKDISFLKLGMESSLLGFPVTLRGSVTGLLKPTSSDPDVQKSIDDAFADSPIYPVDSNIYMGIGLFDSEVGAGVGGGGLPLIQAVMLDLSSIAKVFYFNVYVMRGNWQVSYLQTIDPVLTGFSSDLSSTKGTETEIKLMATSTLSIGVKF